jgi:hypothetical protein
VATAGGLKAMTEHDRPERPDPRNREIFLLRLGIVVAVVVALATVAVAVWAVIDARDNADKIVATLKQSNQANLEKAQAENAAVASVSLDIFLRQYNAYVAAMKTAADAFEAAKAAKGSDRVYALMAAVTVARDKLYTATDNFTDYVDRWRLAAELLNKMLDGNVTHLENSRREDNADSVHDAARRIVSSAPDLAAPLRVALDRLKPPSTVP